MGINAPYEVMNQHFENAIRASPIHWYAHYYKAYYLYPRWHGGDGSDLLQFVREFTDRIRDNPYLFDVARNAYRDFFEYPEHNPDFYRQPGIWSDLSKVYAISLENHPDSDFVYSSFVYDAHYANPRTQSPIQPLRLRINSANAGLFNDLAYRLATHPDISCRRGDAAVTIAEKVVAIFSTPATLDTLSAAYAEAGNFSAALRTISAALEMPMTHELRTELESHRALYENRRPAHLTNITKPEQRQTESYAADPAFSATP